MTARSRRSRTRRELGASAVEYGLMLAAIAAVVVAAVFAFGSVVHDSFRQTTACLQDGGRSGPYPTCDEQGDAP